MQPETGVLLGITEGMYLMMQHDTPEDQLSTGESHSVKDFAEKALHLLI